MKSRLVLTIEWEPGGVNTPVELAQYVRDTTKAELDCIGAKVESLDVTVVTKWDKEDLYYG